VSRHFLDLIRGAKWRLQRHLKRTYRAGGGAGNDEFGFVN
jgi:hypothetical protein